MRLYRCNGAALIWKQRFSLRNSRRAYSHKFNRMTEVYRRWTESSFRIWWYLMSHPRDYAADTVLNFSEKITVSIKMEGLHCNRWSDLFAPTECNRDHYRDSTGYRYRTRLANRNLIAVVFTLYGTGPMSGCSDDESENSWTLHSDTSCQKLIDDFHKKMRQSRLKLLSPPEVSGWVMYAIYEM